VRDTFACRHLNAHCRARARKLPNGASMACVCVALRLRASAVRTSMSLYTKAKDARAKSGLRPSTGSALSERCHETCCGRLECT
jgi:hypothetical protein